MECGTNLRFVARLPISGTSWRCLSRFGPVDDSLPKFASGRSNPEIAAPKKGAPPNCRYAWECNRR